MGTECPSTTEYLHVYENYYLLSNCNVYKIIRLKRHRAKMFYTQKCEMNETNIQQHKKGGINK